MRRVLDFLKYFVTQGFIAAPIVSVVGFLPIIEGDFEAKLIGSVLVTALCLAIAAGSYLRLWWKEVGRAQWRRRRSLDRRGQEELPNA